MKQGRGFHILSPRVKDFITIPNEEFWMWKRGEIIHVTGNPGIPSHGSFPSNVWSVEAGGMEYLISVLSPILGPRAEEVPIKNADGTGESAY